MEGWLYHVNQFFDFSETPKERKLKLVREKPCSGIRPTSKAIRLGGGVLIPPTLGWGVYIDRVSSRFGVDSYGDPVAELK